jgi:AMP deaminase
VDDESKPDRALRDIAPEDVNTAVNPPYAYYAYFMWANLFSLNSVRGAKVCVCVHVCVLRLWCARVNALFLPHLQGLNLFTFRPHCGESGSIDHLAAAFLTADGINHGTLV